MATKIKIVTAKDFLEVTPEGMIDLTTSRQLLADIAKAEQRPVDYELLVDFRDTRCQLSVFEVYQLAGELCQHGDAFGGKMALLVHPGINFERASFFQSCSLNQGYLVNAFTDYEKAMRWVLSAEDLPNNTVPSNKAESGDGKNRRGSSVMPGGYEIRLEV
jgi:hypothetical protein